MAGMIDVAKLRAEMRAGLEGVTPGPWGVDGYDIDGPIGNGDYVVLGEAWSSHKTQAHIARCSPDNIAALLDALNAAERERDESRNDFVRQYLLREKAERERDEARTKALGEAAALVRSRIHRSNGAGLNEIIDSIAVDVLALKDRQP